MCFLGILFHFLYFGSGASASSYFPVLVGQILIFLIICIPIVFFIYKVYSFRKQKQLFKFKTYLISGILVTLFMAFNLLYCF